MKNKRDISIKKSRILILEDKRFRLYSRIISDFIIDYDIINKIKNLCQKWEIGYIKKIGTLFVQRTF